MTDGDWGSTTVPADGTQVATGERRESSTAEDRSRPVPDRVLGRPDGAGGPAGRIGVHRAPDGSDGAPVAVDLDRPHVAFVVGKRGYGKSYTLGVLAEELARARGVAPVILDPMGVFTTLSDPAEGEPVPAGVVDRPTVSAGTLGPRSWCDLLGLDPEAPAGGLVWRAATGAKTLTGMVESVAGTDADRATRRAARNHLTLADSWGVFDADGLDAGDLCTGGVTVLDVSGLDRAAADAVALAVADALYAARVEGQVSRLPWLLVDEAHAFFDGVARRGLRTLATRGRQPGVSLALATQRPGAVPDVIPSQSDLTVAHRLTARPDREALERARPSYVGGTIAGRTPGQPGEATVVDDATESVHAVRVRERDTPHGGASPRASDVATREG